MGDVLVSVVLPLTLAFIMFTLGLGLRISDFVRVFQMPKAFFTGFVNQVVLLPVVGFMLALLFRLPPELAVGMMILALSPGGAATNVMTKIAGGNVPLSISLTAVATILSMVTIPLILSLSVSFFLSDQMSGDLDTVSLSISMLLMTVIPVGLGMIFTAAAPGTVAGVSGILSIVATILFALIIVAAISANISVVIDNISTVGAADMLLVCIMMPLGMISARVMGLSPRDGTTISIESGIQNATLGVAISAILAGQLLGDAAGISTFGVPSAVYGALMYFVAIPFMLWRRRANARL